MRSTVHVKPSRADRKVVEHVVSPHHKCRGSKSLVGSHQIPRPRFSIADVLDWEKSRISYRSKSHRDEIHSNWKP
ncbi:uncharacterized protein LAJ45_04080 [Morchella importuna]|uniref:uncharacterized protein n=1 Tax=Morchella importuna TaxID=1174673 RepID=UPI001E8DB7B2|nr:uncharacterized protein LAJ45_04080 [Morchella importuna]KAH8152086.1 hypothetical protein LAJ45_04080 [Morchella importuna]